MSNTTTLPGGVSPSAGDSTIVPPVGPTPAAAVSMTPTTIPTYPKIFVICGEEETLLSKTPVTVAAPFPSLMGGVVMGPSGALKGSTNSFNGPGPVRRAFDMVGNNGVSSNSFTITTPTQPIKNNFTP